MKTTHAFIYLFILSQEQKKPFKYSLSFSIATFKHYMFELIKIVNGKNIIDIHKDEGYVWFQKI